MIDEYPGFESFDGPANPEDMPRTFEPDRKCTECGKKLNIYNAGPLCHACEDKKSKAEFEKEVEKDAREYARKQGLFFDTLK